MFQKEEISSTDSFEFDPIRIGALLWAEYLPGVQPIELEEIIKNSKIYEPNYFQALAKSAKMDRESVSVTSDQVIAFIEAFVEEISKKAFEENDDGPSYIQIGHPSFYGPPNIIIHALKKAKIGCLYGLFPYHSVMRIYANGSIQFNEKVYCTNPLEMHYDNNINFDTAPYMVITGKKFKVFEIPYTKDDIFYDGFINRGNCDLSEYNPSKKNLWEEESNVEESNKKYIKIYLDDFLGTESELLNMSNQDLKLILKEKEQIKAYFKKGTHIYFQKEKDLKVNYCFSIGELDGKPIGEDYYQQTTEVVRVFSALQKGTVVGINTLKTVEPTDFIISRPDDKRLRLLSTGDCNFFEARLCDFEGNILSDKVYQPGMTLPLFSEIGAVQLEQKSDSLQKMSLFSVGSKDLTDDKLYTELQVSL